MIWGSVAVSSHHMKPKLRRLIPWSPCSWGGGPWCSPQHRRGWPCGCWHWLWCRPGRWRRPLHMWECPSSSAERAAASGASLCSRPRWCSRPVREVEERSLSITPAVGFHFKTDLLKQVHTLYSCRILLVQWYALLFTLDIGTIDFRFSSLQFIQKLLTWHKPEHLFEQKSGWFMNLSKCFTSGSLVCASCSRSCHRWSAGGGWPVWSVCCLQPGRNLSGGSDGPRQREWGWPKDPPPLDINSKSRTWFLMPR